MLIQQGCREERGKAGEGGGKALMIVHAVRSDETVDGARQIFAGKGS